jgi:Uma2 family endonuclease
LTISLDHSGSWTVNDVDKFPEDNRRRELVDGSLILRPSPSAGHQKIVGRLGVALEETQPDGYHVNQGMQVRFAEHTAFVPDVVVVRERGWASETTHFPHTDVVLAVEISDGSSQNLDRILKPAIYAAGGIPNFWRIEMDGRIVVHTYRIDAERRAYLADGSFDEVLRVTEPWSLALPIKKLTPRYF